MVTAVQLNAWYESAKYTDDSPSSIKHYSPDPVKYSRIGIKVNAQGPEETFYGGGTLTPWGHGELVESFGGEGLGDLRWVVIKIGDQFFRYDGYYSSYEGTTWDEYDGGWYEVEPKELTVTKYVKVKVT